MGSNIGRRRRYCVRSGTAGGRQAYSKQTHHFSSPVTSTTRCSANCYTYQISPFLCNMSCLSLLQSLFLPLYFIPCTLFLLYVLFAYSFDSFLYLLLSLLAAFCSSLFCTFCASLLPVLSRFSLVSHYLQTEG
jgi:hypothetical protein